MDNLNDFDRAVIVHALFRYADYLRTFDYPFPSVFNPDGIEKLAVKINNMKGEDNE
jgi:hypothetical protein